MSTQDEAAYVGHENLEVMEDAVNYNRWLVTLATRWLPREGRILDFGAGTGTLTRLIRAAGHDVLALEPDGAQAQRLRSDGIETHRSLDSVPESSLAGIVTFNVLEHIEDDASVVRSLAARLRPGGRFFIYVPAFPILYSAMDHKVGHVRRYRRAPLVQMAKSTGLQVVRARHVDSLGFVASLLYRAAAREGELNRNAIRFYDRVAFPASRAIDWMIRGAFGKNLMVLASRPTHP
jgi:2-polyprenyl-3-methyl-5-hydroxy-6-metoxy-1,4-benzoquinol methylase